MVKNKWYLPFAMIVIRQTTTTQRYFLGVILFLATVKYILSIPRAQVLEPSHAIAIVFVVFLLPPQADSKKTQIKTCVIYATSWTAPPASLIFLSASLLT